MDFVHCKSTRNENNLCTAQEMNRKQYLSGFNPQSAIVMKLYPYPLVVEIKVYVIKMKSHKKFLLKLLAGDPLTGLGLKASLLGHSL